MNKSSSSSEKVFSNIIWRFLERFGAYIVSFIVSLVLARVFAEQRGIYGTVAIVTAIIAILQVFVDSGLGTSLIQKKNSDQLDFSTVFWFNCVACLLLYLVLFFMAPLICMLYPDYDLLWPIRILGISLLISGPKNVLQAYVSKNMMFKKFFFATLVGTIVSAIVGIYMALNGFGVWALISQTLINLFIDTIIIWFSIKWVPSLKFSFDRLKGLFKFGWKLLASKLLDTGYRELRTFVIGYRYSSVDLADYNKAKTFPETLVENINQSIDSVLLPAMSSKQDDKKIIKSMTKESIKMSSFIIFPMMVGLAACSNHLVSLLLTDAWLDCVPYLIIFCIIYATYPFGTANLNAIKALGRSDKFLKLEIAKKIVGICILVATMWFGVFWIAIGAVISAVISLIINNWPNRKLINYDVIEQFLDTLPYLLLSLTMGVFVFLIGLLNFMGHWIIILQVIFGVAYYIFGSYLFKFESFNKLIDILKKFRKGKHEKDNSFDETN